MERFTFHQMTLTWLDGGTTTLDGGAMFGAVPKILWSRKYPCNERNQIELPCSPILIQYGGKNYLIDTGVGAGKLDEKQLRNSGIAEQSRIEESLTELSLTPNDIDVILMTHLHSDHASGLTKRQDDKLVPTFPNAIIYTTQIEWDEMRAPNIRSRNTYWQENWESIQHLVKTYEDELEVVPGIQMIHTGGHSNGHAIIRLEQAGEVLLHMADLMGTHAHQNPLWVMAYDDYPMTSIFAKEKLLKEAFAKEVRFTFYHDAYYRMIQWDVTGKAIVSSLKRERAPMIPIE